MTSQGEITVLTVGGYFAGPESSAFRSAAQRALDSGTRDVVVELSGITGVDSTGLEALTWLQRTCLERLGMVKLAGVPDALERVLALTRLSSQFDGHWSVDEAVASLR